LLEHSNRYWVRNIKEAAGSNIGTFSPMVGSPFLKTLFLLISVLALVTSTIAKPEDANAEAAKRLPDSIGNFHARGGASSPFAREALPWGDAAEPYAQRTYSDANGNAFEITLLRTRNDSSAYSLLTLSKPVDRELKLGNVGTASLLQPDRISFFKGSNFVYIVDVSKVPAQDELLQLANSLANGLNSGENDIPVLVKHLPNWETVQPRASYVVSLQGLKDLLPQQRALDVISFEGGAEAAIANYDAGKLLIIEFNTARIASDNDWNIKTKLNELRGAGENANDLPSAYRRVGNYSVFVFGAPSEPVANELIDQVKYQQVVQWLGDNPYAYEEATREFTETTLGVFVSVVKASGLALLTCFAVGGFFGALLFSRRRARQRNVEAYTDAGGMLRLNLDEMTPEIDPARLIGPGN
jgi:hypothetical protein